MEEGLDALAAGDIDGFVIAPDVLADSLDGYPTLHVAGTLLEERSKGFIMGTNQIGQDVFSRIIWGTKIALIVGISSALVSFVIGVPLGLFSGFIGGCCDGDCTFDLDQRD